MKIIVFRYFQFIAILIIGFFIGAGFSNIQISKKIDQLYQLNSELTAKNSDQAITIAELEKSLKKLQGRKMVVKSISVNVTLDKKDEFVQLELEKKAKEMLLPLIGRELGVLDPHTIPAIVNKRRVPIDGDEYLLLVKNTLISEEVIMNIEAKRQIPPTLTSSKN